MTGKNIISPVRKTYPPIDALLTYRQIRKQLETYGEGWALFADPDSGRIYSTFNVFGALTGRASNSQPNLQQLPKRQPIKGLASYRSLIVAGPGNVLVNVDYDPDGAADSGRPFRRHCYARGLRAGGRNRA
jgi:DNA polymerase-1